MLRDKLDDMESARGGNPRSRGLWRGGRETESVSKPGVQVKEPTDGWIKECARRWEAGAGVQVEHPWLSEHERVNPERVKDARGRG